MNSSPPRRRKLSVPALLRLLAGNLAVFLLLLVLAEGLVSIVLVIAGAKTMPRVAERRHTVYDPELGWINEPNVALPEVYGAGRGLHTNAQGFRGEHDTAPKATPGKRRIICSGDSFTLGVGVDDADTWCQQLAVRDPGLETVNMGQGGYGVDQAYLWYRRDAAGLEHQAHLFAFITPDLWRMTIPKFYGYGKPVLEVEDGKLVVKNVPVPRRTYASPWLTHQLENLHRLRLVEVLKGFKKRLRNQDDTARDAQIERLLPAVLAEVARLDAERSSRLVLVFLPTLEDCAAGPSAKWRALVAAQAAALEVDFIDVIAHFQQLPAVEAVELFIREGESEDPSAIGHFNERGHAFATDVIYGELKKTPRLAHTLDLAEVVALIPAEARRRACRSPLALTLSPRPVHGDAQLLALAADRLEGAPEPFCDPLITGGAEQRFFAGCPQVR